MVSVLIASSTTELRPLRSSSDLSSWSVDDVARYIADADTALTPYSDLFRKHVCTVKFWHFYVFYRAVELTLFKAEVSTGYILPSRSNLHF